MSTALFGIWWWYFEGLKAAAERAVRTRRDAVRLHVWSYAHFPFYLGIVIIGVGIRRVVTHATHEPLPPGDVLMWAAGVILLVGAGTALRSCRQRRQGTRCSAGAREPSISGGFRSSTAAGRSPERRWKLGVGRWRFSAAC